MKFDVLTLFPESFEPIKQSILGRALEKNLISLNLINIRDFSKDKHKKVDDTPYGGGAGMVIRPDVVYDAYKSIKDENAKVIYMSPQGNVLNQKKVESLSKEKHLILLCGHYEGIDQRVIDEIVDEEISIGDYVLTGGEIPAMVLIDSVSRYVEGVLTKESIKEESFLQKVDWLSDLKLRLSYAEVGNQSGIGNYDGVQLYNLVAAGDDGAYIGSNKLSYICYFYVRHRARDQFFI